MKSVTRSAGSGARSTNPCNPQFTYRGSNSYVGRAGARDFVMFPDVGQTCFRRGCPRLRSDLFYLFNHVIPTIDHADLRISLQCV